MQIINVDLVPGKVMPILHASQFDVGRSLGVKLYNGGAVYNLTGAEVVSISVRKPDGNIVTETLTNAGGSLVEIITTEQMTACAGASLCEIKIEDAGDVIGSANFVLEVEEDPLDGGIESESEIDNLATQIADINNDIVPPLVAAEVANQYDSGNVIFDNEPTTGHGTGYAVTSDGLKSYVPKVVGDLSDVNINNPQLGEALVFDALGNVINGTVSTVGSIDDLNDVDTTGKANADSLRYNATAQEWEAKPTTVEMDLAEYTALGGDYSGYENTNIIITDAPNLNATAQDISYDGGADTVWDKVEEKADTASLATVATSGLFNDLLSNPFNNNGLIADLNIAVRGPGECKLNVYNGGATNSPSGSAGGWVFTFTNNGSTAYGSQIAFSNGGLYYRALVSNTYGTWRTIATA